jgi:hypothetical protein
MVDYIILVIVGNVILGVLLIIIYKKYRERRNIFKQNNAYFQRSKSKRKLI